MKTDYPKRCKPGYQPAVSLIEVVVAIFLAGNLLVGVLLAMSTHARQARQMQLSQVGIEVLDQFLWRWSTHDFRDERIAATMQSVGLVPMQPEKPQADEFAFGKGERVSIKLIRLPGLDCLAWGMQKIRLEAVTSPTSEVVARLEIVRKVRNEQ